ncbi:dimethylsulfoxide reductase subunit B [Salipaludibacillus sp. CUR1]|uniref:Anaerobic dimethyl sulfoxide reductase subunit B (DMSO reductase iron-sulfur subunit) n=1 Tax=Salipaludibacillus aurantiacus TaxID=1601833 RepID=A0A1H9W0H9_9BACI|nr:MULTISPECIES: DMSO/selenate family reductase complex B subunit [Salipaludibacillus]MCE7792930.1 dimethylsulfoxide reductase subunit B [Salipaludibacillus sp. CUR1]SES27251.1 anaerobic dimethyl sulfoxide reductase subunit B (DMSO reductase iron-sulfur subunit) [Salipaludibacillus aurantiacus]
MGQMGFYYDLETCIGCKGCQIACKDKNDLKTGELFREVHDFEGGSFPSPYVDHVTISCNHCDKPKCVENCPTGAMHKREDGIVDFDHSKCVGCKMCMWSCPYDGPVYLKEEGKVAKCDFCKDLLENNEDPACVSACTMRAIDYGDIEELKEKYGTNQSIRYFPDLDITKPNIVVKQKSR